MRKVIACGLLCVLLAGCGNKEEGVKAPAALELAAAGTQGLADARRRYLAYEHDLTLSVADGRVEPVHKSIEAACVAAVADECVILESSLQQGRETYARTKLRAKPEGIRKIVASLAAQGKVVRQSVEAEDLAAPLADTAKKLRMLEDYRAQLEALRGRAGGDVDALIKVAKELAEVQQQIEGLAGQQAHLQRRVHTELLSVTVSSRADESFWRPVGSALGEFGTRLGAGIAALINALAYLLPWAGLLTLLWLLVRRWRAWRAKRATRG